MKQVSYRDKLSEQELSKLSGLFNLGETKQYSFIEKGNINSNYILITDRGKFVLRVYKFKSVKEAGSELELLKYLSQKNFPCPVPRGSVEKINNKPVSCFEFIEGDILFKCRDEELVEAGKLLAELHLLTENYKPIYKREGEGVSVIRYYLENKKSEILNSGFKDSPKFISFVKSELEKISFKRDLPSGCVHADMKPENMIRGSDGSLYLIDFDNWYIDAFVVDIGSTVMWLCAQNGAISGEKTDIFLKAYERRRKLSENEIVSIKEALLFNCLKQAFKYAYICLPNLEFAEESAYYFLNLYKNIQDRELLIY